MTRRTTIIILSIVALASLAVRVIPHFAKVFADFGIVYLEPDSTYHLRLVLYQIHNHFQFLTWDAYAIYPNGGPAAYRPLLDWLIAIPSWIIGLGNPSEHLVEVVSVFIPPILGTLLIIPLYFLGKTVFNRRTAIIGCILVALMPTEFMNRSRIGFTDNHVLEVLLAVCVILFMILSQKRNNSWYAVLAGLFLAGYLWAWSGAVFIALIIFIWFLIAYLGNTQDPQRKLFPGRVVLCFMVAFVLFLPYLPYSVTKLEIGLPALSVLAVLFYATRWLEAKDRLGYLLTWLGVFISVGLVIFYVYPSVYKLVLFQLASIFWGFGSSINEAQPMNFTIFMFQYGLIVMFFIIGLIMAIKNKVHPLFLVFSFVWIIAMFGQRRWGYYATIPIALMGAYLIDIVLANTGKRFIVAVSCIITLMVSFTLVPGMASMVKSQPDMTENWYRALTWMRENTPEPFPEKRVLDPYPIWIPNEWLGADAYYSETYEKPVYATLSWWDAGHWIIAYAHRIPLSSNTYQYSKPMADFLTSQNENDAKFALEGLNVKYVVLDARMASDGLYYAYFQQATGSYNGWQQSYPNSTVKKLYETENYAGYRLLKAFGDVKVFEVSK